MGLITIFFIASRNEIENQFIDWLPVASEKYVEVKNPFTNEIQLDWGPEPEALKNWKIIYQKRQDTYMAQVSEERKKKSWFTRIFLTNKGLPMPAKGIDFSGLPNVQFKRVDLIKTSTLHTILEEITFEAALESIEKPVLTNPLSNEQGLHCFSTQFIQSLSACNVNEAAQKWFETEEMTMDGFTIDDVIHVLEELQNLAKQAIEFQKALYVFWSL